ncbi:NAD-dependent epimerase/dehydratase family protein [Paenibacillus alkaliterrae]|uniref:NAD-dependent epimerase/dehydratase family protein n=1 Tax=Paenibacillus alkaliterrae TaxID=320909 RepID=UPI001F44E7C9|nr:NAD-dependent epimerase/dehydratase family protein [Paenibacillus alkaliterrae]MCF2939557.1 NAD-dependent epimerase/dehydratase family protein [Paenibacillus alkaliterrae]
MKIIVTGAAGFIGSHLCEFLLNNGKHEVIGIDAFVREELKIIGSKNMETFYSHPRFTLISSDLLHIDWNVMLKGVDVVFHLAGIPGVRSSWGNDFRNYVETNILATQQLLEACRSSAIKKIIFASTSSVYGEKAGKVPEDSSTAPLSPYGVSKLTGEQLCRVYWKNDGVPIVILRFFTVYGPRQRSDMAFHRFIKQMIKNEPITLIGDGTQSRDFTYISDCVEATAAVANQPTLIGETINIGGKERSSILNVIRILENLTGKQATIVNAGAMRGEPMHTWADISKAARILNYEPKVSLTAGLAEELAYLTKYYS